MSAKSVTLVLKRDGAEIASVDMARGCEMVEIGRSHSCRLQTPADDHSVSGRHAKVYWKGSVLLIEDAGSRNGVYFNGRRIDKPVKVERGCLFAIGNCQLLVQADVARKGRKTGLYHHLEFLNGDRVRQLVPIKAKGSGDFIIGLDPICDICLPDMLVSRRHAHLSVKPNGDCWIGDDGSRNGTYVNGEKLGNKDRLLKDGDKISIAYFDLRFLDRSVSHTRSNVGARLGIILVTALVLGLAYVVYQFGPQRPTAEDYRKLAMQCAGTARFDQALEHVESAYMARNASSEKGQNDNLRSQIKCWKETYDQWMTVREALVSGGTKTARLGLERLSPDAYAWSWNGTDAKAMREAAQYARELIRLNTDAGDVLKMARDQFADQALIAAQIESIGRQLQAMAKKISALSFLTPTVKQIEAKKIELQAIQDAIVSINKTLEAIDAVRPDFTEVERTFRALADDVSMSAGVRSYVKSLLPVCAEFLKTQEFLVNEKARISDMEFSLVRLDREKMPLPDQDACARHPRLSDARAAFIKLHESYQLAVSIFSPMIRNLESAKVQNGEKGRLLNYALSETTWNQALSFDCFQGAFPMPSRVDPAGNYDELLGIEYTYANLRELPNPPGRQTSVLMNFIPKCQTVKGAFDQVQTFITTLDRPEGKEFRSGKLGRLYALGAQILADRDQLVKTLKAKAKPSKGQDMDRSAIVAGYYAEYFAAVPSYADLRALEMAFKALQREMTELGEQYENEADPEKRLAIRKEILSKGIPGMEAVRKRWVEVEE